MSTFVIALVLFAITYVLLFALPKLRAFIALGSAVVFSVWLAFFCQDVEFGFADLVGATLGGNITPIGASANITGIGILRREGYEVRARDFMKISVPFTLTAVLSGYLFIWLFWGVF